MIFTCIISHVSSERQVAGFLAILIIIAAAKISLKALAPQSVTHS